MTNGIAKQYLLFRTSIILPTQYRLLPKVNTAVNSCTLMKHTAQHTDYFHINLVMLVTNKKWTNDLHQLSFIKYDLHPRKI